MSTIDMTQVAGLQTVDAEGNVIGTLSVDDLTELVANNLVKSTQNQIAAARSASTMSEASTLAASDDYENTLPIDANPASVRTLDAAGNPKQTGISAFAQVVGGLLPIVSAIQNGLMSSKGFIERTDITDANTRFCGFCRGIFKNTPTTGAAFLISIMNKDLPVGLQLNLGSWPIKIYIRPVWDSFEEWKQIY